MLAMLLLLLARSALFVRRWLRSMRIVLGVSKCVSESLVAVTTASLVELWCRGKRGAAMSSILHFPGSSWLRDSANARSRANWLVKCAEGICGRFPSIERRCGGAAVVVPRSGVCAAEAPSP